jgi:predicted esterase
LDVVIFNAWLRVAMLCACAVSGAVHAAPLPTLKIDASRITVSGVSSGGYMAVQLHVAWSSVFKGAGVIAAGPYYCAQGMVALATTRCLSRSSAPPVDALVTTAKGWAAIDAIDATSHLRTSRVYLFSGSKDSVVAPALVADLLRFYEAFVPASQIVHRSDVAAEHGMPTDDFGNACAVKGRPFINDCDADVAGDLLKHLYGTLAPRNDGTLAGRFVEFDQLEFVAADRGMGAKGWIFVPAACTESGLPCRLLVALHGCQQNLDAIGEDFVRRAGYNRWADVNRIVVLYPQTSSQATNGCWDWWGTTGPDYAQRSGTQLGAIVAMVERLAGAMPRCNEAMNGWHAWFGRAVWSGIGSVSARGSGQKLGWWWQSSTLRESPRGHFVRGTC